MKRTMVVAACLAFLGLTAGMVMAGGKGPKPTVNFARSWDAAVEEAQLLNLPIVVHSHGFY